MIKFQAVVKAESKANFEKSHPLWNILVLNTATKGATLRYLLGAPVVRVNL